MTVVRKKNRNSKAAALAAEINNTLKLENPIRLGSDPYFTITRVPTGSLVMDRITGGGWALGRHYELFGDESVGKSFILYRSMILSQMRGEICAMVDPEHSFDNERFEFLGGNANDLLLQHPKTAEESVAVMMLLAQHSEAENLGIVGIDSVASLVTNDEAKKDPRDEDRIGAQARMMSKALRRITTVNKKTLFLWTNQERMDVGVKFGNPKTTSGGRALRYYATGRMEFRRGGALNRPGFRIRGGKRVETEVQFGRWVQVRVIKDKSTRPNREGAFVFNHDLRMIDPAYEILQLGLEDELIERSSTGRYSYVDLDDHEWKGTEKQFTNWLRTKDELAHELITAIQDNTRVDAAGGVEIGEDD